MQDGIYHVRFSSAGFNGEGLVVLKQGSANGGDLGYLYCGRLVAEGDQITGTLNIKRWNAAHTPLFGPLDNFELQLAGTVRQSWHFSVCGTVAGYPNERITMAGELLAAAA